METLTEIKKILENINLERISLDLKAMPQEEVVVFLAALNQFDKLFLKLDHSWLKLEKNDLRRWGIAYLLLHDLFHAETRESDLTKLEILTTAQIFTKAKEISSQENLDRLSLAYFILGAASLKINHSLPVLISEKIILGEFVSVGGLDNGIWGIRIKKELLPETAAKVLEKTHKGSLRPLAKKYKNFIFDFL